MEKTAIDEWDEDEGFTPLHEKDGSPPDSIPVLNYKQLEWQQTPPRILTHTSPSKRSVKPRDDSSYSTSRRITPDNGVMPDNAFAREQIDEQYDDQVDENDYDFIPFIQVEWFHFITLENKSYRSRLTSKCAAFGNTSPICRCFVMARSIGVYEAGLRSVIQLGNTNYGELDKGTASEETLLEPAVPPTRTSNLQISLASNASILSSVRLQAPSIDCILSLRTHRLGPDLSTSFQSLPAGGKKRLGIETSSGISITSAC
ncbi:hypothetical protein K469DRAFT_682219 [Zopfia rhizophila CBS 207.26]|uniref:Uncharacterized protein n=1 Tax=Zopfia rhizophila CBS 207.26 TaxID=1314779 RepID=A0A6A6EHC4_9PEZI|nr:hypothetical protein K469DRAFT_682219 [Zopfia rhizophila CBS 207.26]